MKLSELAKQLEKDSVHYELDLSEFVIRGYHKDMNADILYQYDTENGLQKWTIKTKTDHYPSQGDNSASFNISGEPNNAS